MKTIKSYLELIRFPNLFTAMADILAGAWIASIAWERWPQEVVFLVFSSVCLYAMGVVFNDYADIEIDRLERPERPLPSGRISKAAALYLGVVLGATGIGLAVFVNLLSLLITLCLLGLILLYDFLLKHHHILGPFTMGMCRSCNLLLGLSIVPSVLSSYWWLSLVSLIYIFTVTAMAKGEVGDRLHPQRVRAMVISILICLVMVLFIPTSVSPSAGILALALFAIWTFSALIPALRVPSAAYIRPAVGKCIVGLPLLNAAIAAPFGGWMALLTVAMFLFFAQMFGRMFAVT